MIVFGFLLYTLIKTMLVVVFMKASQEKDKSLKFTEPLRIIFMFSCIDLQITLIPIVRMAANLALTGALSDIVISVFCVAMLLIEYFMDELLTLDFEYFSKNVLQSRNFNSSRARIFGVIILIFIKEAVGDAPSTFASVVINVMNLSLGLFFIYDHFESMNFTSNSRVMYTVIIVNIVYSFESIAGIAFSSLGTWVSTTLDLDYFMAVLILPILHLAFQLITSRQKTLMGEYLYNIKEVDSSVLYLDIFIEKMLRQDRKDDLELISAWRFHFSSCNDARCYCFLAKYYYSSTHRKTLIEMMEERSNSITNKKIVIFDNQRLNEYIKAEFIRLTTNDNDNCQLSEMKYEELVDLKSINLSLVFSSFYYIQLDNLSGNDVFSLIIRYSSYLTNILESRVGALMNIYNYIYSPQFKDYATSRKIIMLQNHIDLARDHLKNRFKESYNWISSEIFYKAYRFNKDLDRTDDLIYNLSKDTISFFERYYDRSESIHYLLKQCRGLYKKRRVIREELQKINQYDGRSLRYLCQFLNFNRKLEYKERFELLDTYDKLRSQIKQEQDEYSRFSTNIVGSKLNLYSSNNVAVFINLERMNFTVRKFTKNAPALFGYSETELRGMRITDLLPPIFRENHDEYISNFLNQSHKTIVDTPFIKAFITSRTGALTRINLIVKLEYLMGDDVFLGGIIVEDRDLANNYNFAISNDFQLIGGSEEFMKVYASVSLKDAIPLMCALPSLFPHIYVETNENKKNIISNDESTFNMSTDRLFIKPSLQTKEAYKAQKEQIASCLNFELERTEFDTFFYPTMLEDAKVMLYIKEKIEALNILEFKNLSDCVENQIFTERFTELINGVFRDLEMFFRNLSPHKILESDVICEKYTHTQSGIIIRNFILKNLDVSIPIIAEFSKNILDNNIFQERQLLMLSPNILLGLCKFSLLRGKLFSAVNNWKEIVTTSHSNVIEEGKRSIFLKRVEESLESSVKDSSSISEEFIMDSIGEDTKPLTFNVSKYKYGNYSLLSLPPSPHPAPISVPAPVPLVSSPPRERIPLLPLNSSVSTVALYPALSLGSLRMLSVEALSRNALFELFRNIEKSEQSIRKNNGRGHSGLRDAAMIAAAVFKRGRELGIEEIEGMGKGRGRDDEEEEDEDLQGQETLAQKGLYDSRIELSEEVQSVFNSERTARRARDGMYITQRIQELEKEKVDKRKFIGVFAILALVGVVSICVRALIQSVVDGYCYDIAGNEDVGEILTAAGLLFKVAVYMKYWELELPSNDTAQTLFLKKQEGDLKLALGTILPHKEINYTVRGDEGVSANLTVWTNAMYFRIFESFKMMTNKGTENTLDVVRENSIDFCEVLYYRVEEKLSMYTGVMSEINYIYISLAVIVLLSSSLVALSYYTAMKKIDDGTSKIIDSLLKMDRDSVKIQIEELKHFFSFIKLQKDGKVHNFRKKSKSELSNKKLLPNSKETAKKGNELLKNHKFHSSSILKIDYTQFLIIAILMIIILAPISIDYYIQSVISAGTDKRVTPAKIMYRLENSLFLYYGFMYDQLSRMKSNPNDTWRHHDFNDIITRIVEDSNMLSKLSDLFEQNEIIKPNKTQSLCTYKNIIINPIFYPVCKDLEVEYTKFDLFLVLNQLKSFRMNTLSLAQQGNLKFLTKQENDLRDHALFILTSTFDGLVSLQRSNILDRTSVHFILTASFIVLYPLMIFGFSILVLLVLVKMRIRKLKEVQAMLFTFPYRFIVKNRYISQYLGLKDLQEEIGAGFN